MAHAFEGTTEIVEAVKFSFFTDEEVRKCSFKKITSPAMLDDVGRPLPGGLYDPALGPIDENSPCQSCGQRSFHCPGHCGHIDLVSLVYNPLLFNLLHNLLQKICFFCHHFRASSSLVHKYVSQLKLIRKGDVVGAKNLDLFSPSESLYPEDSDGSQVSCSSTVNSIARDNCSEYVKQQEWTSLQCIEALSVLDNFLKLKPKDCKNCKAKNPQVTKPTFGWFHMTGLTDAQTRANIIRGSKLDRPLSGVVEEKSSSEVENVNDMFPWGDGVDTAETHSSIAPTDGIQDTVAKKVQRKGAEVPPEYFKQKSFFSGPLLPSEVRDIMERLWENEPELCSFISDIQQQRLGAPGNTAGCSMFFLETVLVPPLKFRPPSKGQVSVMEHPQTVLLGKVLQANIDLGNAHTNNSDRPKIINRWMDLQQSINVLFDSKTAAGQGQRDGTGICQLLEKKEGVFRQKMMGKRVNFACRSVISPDPYLAVNEIGIPPYFALRLTYPEKVTPWNVAKLRDAIVNGPEIHPGATHYVDKLSTVKLAVNKKMRISISRKLPSSRGVVAQPGKSSDYQFEGKIVYRHLQDGDIVLVNRQPTLHKPSIMAHVVRVLKGEKTLRMHYANCSTYNADFDGDEMNVHFPQDEISRAEAYNIVNANNQYIVPSRGDPIRGLIQDHIVSAVLLTKKDTFLTHEQYNQLLYGSGLSSGSGSFVGKPGQKVSVLDSEDEMQPLLPAIWKPEPLWSGKQVITALLNHITRGRKPFTTEKDGKIPREYFGSEIDEKKSGKGKDPGSDKKKERRIEKKHGECTLLIYKNELVRGVIDKAQFDKFGLVHMVQELYGSNTAGILLSVLSRLFTLFLQMHGFTCGVDDLLILQKDDNARMRELDKSENIGELVHCKFIGSNHGKIDLEKLQVEVEKIIRSNGEAAITRLDRMMKNELNELTSKVNKDLLLKGLVKPFPKNCLSLMTTTGAKGSTVNFSQISSFLGQQDLEGKRVPRMVSGKTLPCFPSWDCAARAGGFISDRFLTGLRPQEYYFHCMAGREGLVDTAVKTSRSGYLQRCLVKNLECLKVCYDYTVRDADGSIVQFNYGDDGVDVHQTSFITEFEALAMNQEVIREKYGQDGKFNNYIQKLPKELRKRTKKFIEGFMEEREDFNNTKEQKDFMNLVKQKYISSLAQPGEPVGVLAAQSVGEPSTQMTLNTFHLAGRGEVNVTLGIPRLQEILMTAANDIKTPIMTCPLQMGRSKDDAERLAAKLKKVTVADITESMEVSVMPFTVQDHQTCSIYKLKMKLYEPALYPPHTGISLEDCEETLEAGFVRELEDSIQNHLLLLSKISGIKNFLPDSRSMASKDTDEDASGDGSAGGNGDEDDDDDDDDGEDDGGAEDLGSDAQKRKNQALDEMDYGDSEGEPDEGEPSTEIDHAEDEVEISKNEEVEVSDNEEFGISDPRNGTSKMSSKSKSSRNKKAKPEAKRKKRSRVSSKEYDRAIFVEAKGTHFEAHFRFTNEPHILLAQIAQKAANKVYIRSAGKIDMCQLIDCNKDQVIYYGKDPKKRENIPGEEKKKLPALQTAGVDFPAFWKMQDDLDVRYVYSNNVHAMLSTYGVEAARATIMKEVFNVFNAYGVKVNIRHLSLIADFMTHSGGYRPMNRHGGIAESVSPFSKMTFETASKFIVQAASHGMADNLESASARICLGLPVKMGTGCFDLMQKIEI